MRALLFAAAMSLTVPAAPPPANACTAPRMPALKMSERATLDFVDALEAYHQCVQAFVRERKAAAQKHQQAAQDALAAANAAVRAYNDFVEAAERATKR